MAILCLAFFVFVVGLLSLDADTRSALQVMPLWFLFLFLAYRLTRRGRRRSMLVFEHASAAE
ncbi:hypothetical protein PPGU19_087760 (plasmid) [Paraburkholderia sp. PGU19]|nr:hypothetical protein PPGU19_087760 [Paraburkholderia sp. PGU19]